MKVVCDREKLREGLAIANNVIPGKSTKPVLENVCLVATDGGATDGGSGNGALELVGADVDVSVRYRIDDVQVGEPGPAVIPARVALEFVRDLGGETVSLETDGSQCAIRSGPDGCELVTMDPDEFPVISRFEDEDTVTIQGGRFTRLVNQTAFAAAREPGRYAMHGILVELEGDELRLVASDGRRMALASCTVDASKIQGAIGQTIVPTKGMQLFCRAIADPLDQVHLRFGENQVGLKTKNAEIFARLIDGEFPRYSAVVPQDAAHTMEADRETFGRKLRLVANVAGDEARAVKLQLAKGQLELTGRSAGRGEAKASMEVAFKDGPADIAFNPDYVLDGLKCCDQDQVVLEFNDSTSPGKFRMGESCIYVVMPITVNA